MGRLVTIMLVAAALPAMGATAFSSDLRRPGKEAPSLKECFSPDALLQPVPLGCAAALQQHRKVSEPVKLTDLMHRPAKRCYYIRQLNAHLHKPKGKPELVPLADKGADPEMAPGTTGKSECMTDAVVRNTGTR